MRAFILTAILLSLAGCGPRDASKKAVDAAAATLDPAKLKLEKGMGDQMMIVVPSSDIQSGIITLGDGERVKFWFQSHHLGHDLGCTRFQYGDGTVDYLNGHFCCEVILPDKPLANRKELKEFIAAHDGESP